METRPKRVLLPHTGKGKEVREYLEKQLGIPDGATEFKVIVCAGDIIRVECKFNPTEQED